MRYRQLIIALLLALTWLTSVFHVGMEANGWLPEHTHKLAQVLTHSHDQVGDDHAHDTGHAHHHSQGHEHSGSAHVDLAHDPVVARSSAPEGRSLLWLLALCTPLVGVVFWFAPTFRPRVHAAPPPPRWREEHALARWCFVWRCASFTTAPPALA
jgi:hypothetical protein